jgi:hypothetical protein
LIDVAQKKSDIRQFTVEQKCPIAKDGLLNMVSPKILVLFCITNLFSKLEVAVCALYYEVVAMILASTILRIPPYGHEQK